MKKQIILLGVILLLITVGLSGCELLETKPDYINVTCCAEIYSFFIDKNGTTLKEIPVGLPCKVDFIKDGGERFTLQCEITEDGFAQSGYVNFKLYNKQSIEAELTVPKIYKGYESFEWYHQTLTWETIRDRTDFGGNYTWFPRFGVNLYVPRTP